MSEVSKRRRVGWRISVVVFLLFIVGIALFFWAKWKVAPGKPEDLRAAAVGNLNASPRVLKKSEVLLIGGGSEVTEAFRKWGVTHSAGGDVLILRERGEFAYNEYFYNMVPQNESSRPNSVETIIVDSREKANSAYVKWAVDHAEVIWFGGGQQDYALHYWRGTDLMNSVNDAVKRGVLVGGSSSGMAILSDHVYAPGIRYRGSTSEEAILDPFNERMRIHERLFDIPLMNNTVTDMHVAQKNRLGRLVAFLALARQANPTKPIFGIGLDEGTALYIDDMRVGHFVVDAGRTSSGLDNPPPWYSTKRRGYVLIHDDLSRVEVLEKGQPLVYSKLGIIFLNNGDSVDFKSVQPSNRLSIDGRKPDQPMWLE